MPSPGAQRGDVGIGRGGIRGDIERDDLSAQIGDEADFSEDIADSLGLGTVSDQDIAAALGGIASGNRLGSGYGRDWGRSRTDQGIAGGRFDFGGSRSGLLDGGWDDDEAYEGEMMDAYSGLLGGGNGFYDEDEDYQGQMMDAYTKDFEGDYDARNFGQKFGDWFNKNNPIINALRSLGIDANLDQSLDINDDDRDDSADIYRCEQAGGTWDGGSCVMPSDGNGDDGNGDDDNGGDVDYGKFGKPDPFASINRKRQMWYHPMMGGTGHGDVYSPYSGERPEWVSESIWDYKPPRGGAEFRNWASDLRKWASGS